MVTGRALVAGAIVGAWGLYLLSLMIGLWAAYDRWLALPRFALLSGGALFLALYLCTTTAKATARALFLATGSGLLAGAIGIFFLLTHNWQAATPTDFQLLATITAWVQGRQPTWAALTGLTPFHFHENAVAGALMVLLPLGGTGWRVQWQRQRFGVTVITGAALLVAIFALLLTFSRSAWVGLAVATSVAGFTITRATRWRRLGAFLCGALLLSLAVITFVLIPDLLNTVVGWLGWQAVGGTVGSRLTVWQNAVTLVPDYWFTGSGLQSTAMVLSSYVYLLHVPYLAHGHNLYLQMALEQGAPALVAFGIGAAGLLWLSRAQIAENPLVTGATVGLLALLVYGWFDAELYSSLLAPLLFLPIGLLAKFSLCALQPRSGRLLFVGSILPVVTILLLAGFIGLPTLLMVNRVALQQSRMELSRYAWPAWPLQDAVRQALPVDFARITAQYRQVLAQTPDNVTAQRRLGQILLSQNDVVGAERHLVIAHRLAPDQRATRQLLGEVYALQGNVEAAERIWQGLDLSQGQLTLRFQWYAETGKFRESLQLARAAKRVVARVE